MNNFNNMLTKTESLRTLKGGGGGWEIQKVGGGEDLLDTCKLYIIEKSSSKIAKFHRKKGGRDLLRPPLNQPMHYLH